MHISKTYMQTALHYGAYYGLASILFNLLLYYTVGNPLGQVSWLGVWIPVVFICVAMKNHRDKNLEGYISYWEAFRAGFFTIVFGGALYALLMYVFGTTMAPDMLNDYKMQMMQESEKMREMPFFSESLIDTMMEGIDKTTMGSIVSGDYINKLIGAAVVAFIAAAVYKKSKMPTDLAN